MVDYHVYNMQYDETDGSAIVRAMPYGEWGESFVEWRLALKHENGWKIWLEESVRSDEYYPQPMLEATARLGDFLVEASGYNEGKFQQLGISVAMADSLPYRNSKETELDWPTFFTIEYKLTQVYISYLGEESLAGHRIRVVVSDKEEDNPGSVQGSPNGAQGSRNESQGWAMMETVPSKDGTGESQIGSYGYGDSDGNSNVVFDGAELMAGESRLVHGVGNGFVTAGNCWKPDDQMNVHVWIYVDEVLVAEGDVRGWNGKR